MEIDWRGPAGMASLGESNVRDLAMPSVPFSPAVRLGTCLVAIVLTACTPRVWVRDGNTAEDRELQWETCRDRPYAQASSGVPPTGPTVAASAAIGFAGGVGEGIARARAITRCMETAGWRLIPRAEATPDQAREADPARLEAARVASPTAKPSSDAPVTSEATRSP